MSENNINPFAEMNPISQYDELQENIKELKKNVELMITTIQPIISIPCQISSTISNSICGLSSVLDSGLNTLSGNTDDIDSIKGPLSLIHQFATKSLQNITDIQQSTIGGVITPSVRPSILKTRPSKPTQASSPGTKQAGSPKTTQASSSRTKQASSPKTTQASSSGTKQASSPKTTQASSSGTKQASSPKTIQASSSGTKQTSSPKTIQASSPKTIQASSSGTKQTSSPKPKKTNPSKSKQTSSSKPKKTNPSKSKQRRSPKSKKRLSPKSGLRKQRGGHSYYHYIINPLTNKKVSLNSSLGINIIKKYINIL